MSSSTRLSLRLRESIVAKSKAHPPTNIRHNTTTDDDHIFMHILDCIGALSCIRADQMQKSKYEERPESNVLFSKHRVFWQAVREIADREARSEDTSTTEKISFSCILHNKYLDFFQNSFPDDSKASDGRMWLPLHFAVTLPNINIVDFQTIFTADPAAIKAPVDETSKLNPCHLAATVKNPRLEVIQRLQIYYTLLGSSLDKYSNTPLHLAAASSNDVAMIRELAPLHPAALELKNELGSTPLHMAAYYANSVEIVRELVQLHPAALEVTDELDNTPLHHAARYSTSVEVVQELASLSPTALVTMNRDGVTPLSLVTSYYGIPKPHEKLPASAVGGSSSGQLGYHAQAPQIIFHCTIFFTVPIHQRHRRRSPC